MEKYVKRTQKDYNMSFKLSVVKEVESGQISVTAATKKYGIQGRNTVLNWLRKFGNFDWENHTPSKQVVFNNLCKLKNFRNNFFNSHTLGDSVPCDDCDEMFQTNYKNFKLEHLISLSEIDSFDTLFFY